MANKQRQGSEQQAKQQQVAPQATTQGRGQSGEQQQQQQQSGCQKAQTTSGHSAQLAQSGQRDQGGFTRRSAGLPSLFVASPFDLMRRSPFALMQRFSDKIDRIFEDFRTGGGLGAPQLSSGGSSGLQQRGGFGQGFFAPPVEMFEREGQLVVCADLEGLTQDDVRVEIVDEGLLLAGERRYEHQESQDGVLCSERSYGTFRCWLVPLPEGGNSEQAQATFNNGVLEITMQAPERQ